MKEYIWEVLIAADRLGNAVLGGSADDTISARCGKKINKGDRDWETQCAPNSLYRLYARVQ